MLDWIGSLPTVARMGFLVLVFVGFAWLGIIFIRPFLRPLVGRGRGDNELVGNTLQFYAVMYGLLLGLLVVGTYQDYLDALAVTEAEASTVLGLERSIRALPEPLNQELRAELTEYTRVVIEEDWPAQRVGQLPAGSAAPIGALQTDLFEFEPETMRGEILLDSAVQQYYQLLDLRRQRFYSVNTQLPAILWYVVLIGGFLTIVIMWLFDMRPSLQLALGGLVAFFIATMIGLIFELDSLYSGQLTVTSEPYILVYRALTGQ